MRIEDAMKQVLLTLFALTSFNAMASEPTPIGEGRYMLSDRAMTMFSSTGGLVAGLVEEANEFCQEKSGVDAILLDTRGEEARIGRGPTASIQFRCGSVDTEPSVSTGHLDAIAKLKSLLDDGAITQEEYDAQKKKLLGD